MLISLSSRNEPSNADFQNYFSDTLIIPAFSYIGLINASFSQSNTDQLYNVESPNNTFQLRMSYLDITNDIIVPPKLYTLEELAIKLNALCSNISTVWKIVWQANPGANGNTIDLYFYRSSEYYGKDGAINNPWSINANDTSKQGYITLGFGSPDDPPPTFTPNLFPTASVIAENDNCDGWTAVNPLQASYIYSFFNTATYPYPANLPPLEKMYCEDFTGSSRFTIMSANTPVDYSFLPIAIKTPGSKPIYQPGDGDRYLRVLNGTGTRHRLDMIVNGQAGPYILNQGPGNSYEICIAPNSDVDDLLNYNVLFKTYGQANMTVYSLPLDLTPNSGLAWGTGQQPHHRAFNVDFNDKINWQLNTVLPNTPALWNSTNTFKSHYGIYAGTGSSFGQTLFLTSAPGGNVAGPSDWGAAFNSTMPNEGNIMMRRCRYPNQYFNQRIKILQNRIGATPTDLPNASGIMSLVPTLYSVGFAWTTNDDNSAPANNIQCLFNFLNFNTATNQIVFESQTADLTTDFLKIGDGVTAFGGFVENTTYMIGVATQGTTSFNIYIADSTDWQTNNDTFKHTFTLAGTSTQPLTYLGGDSDPANVYTPLSFNGVMFDFNVSQVNAGDERVYLQANPWNAQFGERVAGSLKNGSPTAQTNDWYNISVKGGIYPNPDTDAGCLLPIDYKNVGHLFERNSTTPGGDANPSSYRNIEFGNFNFQPLLQIQAAERALDAPASTYDLDADLVGIHTIEDSNLMDDLGYGVDSLVTIVGSQAIGAPLQPVFPYNGLGNPPVALTPTEEPIFDIGPSNVLNVNIENLSHRTYNGEVHSITKSIMTLPQNINEIKNGDQIIRSYESTTPRFVALNNSMDINLNQLEVRICDSGNVTEKGLVGPTHLLVEIKTKQEIADTF